MDKSLLKYFDMAYFIRFLIIFLVLYFFHLFYYGITTPAGMFYSSFLEQHLNYINWVKSSILYGSNILAHILGFPTHIEGQLTLKVSNRPGVNLNFACLGLGISSFWIAFITAHSSSWQKRIYWCLAGVIAIWLINCIRITTLLISMEKNWSDIKYIDHHDMFNIASYILIFILIYLYNKAGNMQAHAVTN